MSSLIVSLPLEPATSATEWSFVLTPDGRAVGDEGRTAAVLLPLPRGPGAEVAALVPVQALAWHKVTLPKGMAPGAPRLRAVLEGLLEEQLLDDPETVHIAIEPGARAGEPAWVGVCDRAWLRQALHALEAAGRPATRIVPEFAPEGPVALAVIGDAQQPVVVASSDEGVLSVPLAAATLPLLPPLPEDAPCLAEPAVAAAAEHLLPHKVTLQQTAQRWLAASRTRWDLAQFEFASSPRARAWKKAASAWADLLKAPAWRPARWAVAALVAVNLVGLNAWAWKERAGLQDKRDAIRATLTQTFPQVRVVVDAPVQMEREVAALRQQTGTASPQDLDALLGALGTALPPGRGPSSLQYTGGRLRAAGLSLAADEFRQVAERLKNLGYAATQEEDTLVVAAEDAR
jgi:general secretion pathway protein L